MAIKEEGLESPIIKLNEITWEDSLSFGDSILIFTIAKFQLSGQWGELPARFTRYTSVTLCFYIKCRFTK